MSEIRKAVTITQVKMKLKMKIALKYKQAEEVRNKGN
jgi:hypothetical protein